MDQYTQVNLRIFYRSACIFNQDYPLEGTQQLLDIPVDLKLYHSYGIVLDFTMHNKRKKREILPIVLGDDEIMGHMIIHKSSEDHIGTLLHQGIFHRKEDNLRFFALKELYDMYYRSREHWTLHNTKGKQLDFQEIIAQETAYSFFGKYLNNLLTNTKERTVILKTAGVDYDQLRKLLGFEELKHHNHMKTILYRTYKWPLLNFDYKEQNALILRVVEPYVTYYQLRNIIKEGKYFTHYKPVILDVEPYESNSYQDIHGYKILLATLFSQGAYYVVDGIENLCLEQVAIYFKFSIWYRDILYDDSSMDITKMLANRMPIMKYYENFSYSIGAVENKVWINLREHSQFMSISLINLYGNTGNFREVKNAPKIIKQLSFTIPVEEAIKGVYSISPDEHLGMPRHIEYEVIDTNGKECVHFTLKQLQYWTVIVLEK